MLSIQNLDRESFGTTNYDLIIGGIGYESRARHFAESAKPRATRKVAIAFDRQRVLEFNTNYSRMAGLGYECFDESDDTFEPRVRSILEESKARTGNGKLRVSIDISSLTRFRTAIILETLVAARKTHSVRADFVYSPAEYSRPGQDPEIVTTCQPVTSFFSGWSNRPDLPTAAFVGLGYEFEKAIGVLEYLEPGYTWTFAPVGTDARYERAVSRANATLLRTLSHESQVAYDVLDPLGCFTVLNSLVGATKANARPVIVPLGPKIFALVSMLVSLVHTPAVSVWRVSSGELDDPRERKATGDLVCVSVIL